MGKIIYIFTVILVINCCKSQESYFYEIKNIEPITEGVVYDSVYANIINNGINNIPILISSIDKTETLNLKYANNSLTISQLSIILLRDIIKDNNFNSLFNESLKYKNKEDLQLVQSKINNLYNENKSCLKFVPSIFEEYIETPAGDKIKKSGYFIKGNYIIECN